MSLSHEYDTMALNLCYILLFLLFFPPLKLFGDIVDLKLCLK